MTIRIPDSPVFGGSLYLKNELSFAMNSSGMKNLAMNCPFALKKFSFQMLPILVCLAYEFYQF
jgi:hypothetical protein